MPDKLTASERLHGEASGMVSDKRLAELGRQYNAHAEQAAVLYLDGYLDEAHAAADLAIAAVSELHRRQPHDKDFAEAYADACRNRAEIRTLLAEASDHRGPVQRHRLGRGGADDARKAIELYEQGDTQQFPTRIASVRLNLAELLTMPGRRAEARTHADDALADYRQHLGTDRESGATSLARALERYADLLSVGLPESPPEAREARLSAVTLYRPYAKPGTSLWNNRYSQGTTWSSTPTLERFGATARRLATDFTNSDAQAIPALLDAAEVEAAMVTNGFMFAGPLDLEHLYKATTILDELADRLDGTTAGLAARCRAAVPKSGYPQGRDWFTIVRALRPDVEAAARQMSDS